MCAARPDQGAHACGPTARIPSEPVWRGGARTCWYGQVQGPGSDYSDVCRVAVMDATPSGFQLGFSDGYVAPGGKSVARCPVPPTRC